MRKAGIISVILLFGLSQGAYLFIYNMQQKRIRREMKMRIFAGIPDAELQVFDLNAISAQVNWKEEGKEFLLHGEMYDVVRIKKGHGKTQVFCINDKREKKILENIADEAGMQGGKEKNKTAKHTLKYKLPDFISGAADTPAEFTSMRNSKFASAETVLPSSFILVNAPPPRQ